MNSSLLLTGIGLRPAHYEAVLEKQPSVAWLEVHTENYFGDGGPALQALEKAREHYPISLHGVNLSLGSADELNWHHLKKLKELMLRIEPCLISDHLAWSSIDGQYLPDLLPLPYTEETLAHVIARIQQTQEYLGRQILIENISSYVRYEQSTLSEMDFIQEAARQSGCGILLDINNIYVTATNFNVDPYQYLGKISSALVQEIHLGGFSTTLLNGKEILIDTHNRPIVPAVWDLYRHTIQQIGRKPTMIEWDSDLPALETLCLEAYRAEKIMRENYDASKLTSRTG